jgi:hypothetical protein
MLGADRNDALRGCRLTADDRHFFGSDPHDKFTALKKLGISVDEIVLSLVERLAAAPAMSLTTGRLSSPVGS